MGDASGLDGFDVKSLTIPMVKRLLRVVNAESIQIHVPAPDGERRTKRKVGGEGGRVRGGLVNAGYLGEPVVTGPSEAR